jgi:hypothetical protein
MSLRKSYFQCVAFAVLAVALIGCGGGSSTPSPTFVDTGGDPPGIVGNLSNPTGTPSYPELEPIEGQLSSAPLGTNPLYEVQDAKDVIVTRPVSGVSSLGRSTSDESQVLWVAIVPRGEPVDPGNASPPFHEGDAVDLYMRYLVYEGQLTLSRTWKIDAARLNYTDEFTHPAPGTYEAVMPFILPYGSYAMETVLVGGISGPKTSSAFVIQDFEDWNDVSFEIEAVALEGPVYYPASEPDDSNDEPAGCMPDEVAAEWVSDTEVHVVTIGQNISNVVLLFDDGTVELIIPDVERNDSYFSGTGENLDKTIETVFVKAGCNESGWGRGYGERIDYPGNIQELAMAQMVWEDLLGALDYDYNDFVGRIRAIELRNMSEELVQVNLTVKALARSAGYPNQWQLNVGANFPTVTDMEVVTIVDQFYNDGTPHGDQRVYYSVGGASVPVFTPLDNAIPYPNGYNSVNCVKETPFVAGDYAEVTLILSHSIGQGSYTPMPYAPEMRIQPAGSNDIYTIGLWTAKGDPVNDDGMPLGFIVQDTYAWPLEFYPVSDCYEGVDYWIKWINDEVDEPPLLNWWDENPVDDYVFSLDKFI